MIGFVYAGQGSQYVGQGKDFYDTSEIFRTVFDRAVKTASEAGASDIKMLSFEGPMEELSKTNNTQPAMAAFASGITAMLFEEGIRPDFSMGLSLGEYSALHAAGVFDADTLIKLLVARGRFMTEAAEGRDVSMSAVLGSTRELVEECCKKAEERFGGEKTASPSNYNCPGQIVISGDTEAIQVAEELLREGGTKRIKALKVSGPFHTRLMKSAGDALAVELQKAQYGEMRSRVIFNCIGREKNASENIPDLLVKQVQSPVYLEDSIRYMGEQGVTTVIEIGPGKAIGKMIKKTCPDMNVISIDKAEDFQTVKETIK